MNPFPHKLGSQNGCLSALKGCISFIVRHTIEKCKMLSIAAVSVFERLYVSLGVITYLDISKGLKTAYREFFIKTHIIDKYYILVSGMRFKVRPFWTNPAYMRFKGKTPDSMKFLRGLMCLRF